MLGNRHVETEAKSVISFLATSWRPKYFLADIQERHILPVSKHLILKMQYFDEFPQYPK